MKKKNNDTEPELVELVRCDSLSIYLREIGKFKLITPEREIELAKLMKSSNKKTSEEARRELIESNLRLVVKIARDYMNFGLALPDLINEGNIGLMKAVERFKPTKAKLSTYAGLWIKQSIRRAISNMSRDIRIPVHMLEDIRNMKKVASKLYIELGYQPTAEEIATRMSIPVKKIERMLTLVENQTVSLDSQVGNNDDDGGDLSEVVADPRAEDPSKSSVDQSDYEWLHKFLSKLPERECAILFTRFGINNGKPHTLEETGAKFGVTRERIRQIQVKCFSKLRARMNGVAYKRAIKKKLVES